MGRVAALPRGASSGLGPGGEVGRWGDERATLPPRARAACSTKASPRRHPPAPAATAVVSGRRAKRSRRLLAPSSRRQGHCSADSSGDSLTPTAAAAALRPRLGAARCVPAPLANLRRAGQVRPACVRLRAPARRARPRWRAKQSTSNAESGCLCALALAGKMGELRQGHGDRGAGRGGGGGVRAGVPQRNTEGRGERPGTARLSCTALGCRSRQGTLASRGRLCHHARRCGREPAFVSAGAQKPRSRSRKLLLGFLRSRVRHARAHMHACPAKPSCPLIECARPNGGSA